MDASTVDAEKQLHELRLRLRDPVDARVVGNRGIDGAQHDAIPVSVGFGRDVSVAVGHRVRVAFDGTNCCRWWKLFQGFLEYLRRDQDRGFCGGLRNLVRRIRLL